MTNTELVALLREARKFVVDAERLWIEWDNEQEERAVVSMLARIDDALAEHDAVPPSEEPVWHMTGSPVGTLTADLGDWVLRVRWEGQYAAWDATRYGRESDEKRAKSAAVAAARGMR